MPILCARLLPLLALSTGALAIHAAATTYHFSTTSEGAYHRQTSGTVTVDGAKCRIDFDTNSADIIVMTAAICSTNDTFVAVNDANSTWFRIPSSRLAARSLLFSFHKAAVRDVSVSSEPVNSRERQEGVTKHVTFVYGIEFSEGFEKLHGEVRGDVRVWSDAGTLSGFRDFNRLPFTPTDIATGYPMVDDALQHALGDLQAASRSEITVSRSLAGGPVLTEKIIRRLDSVKVVNASPAVFQVPAQYVNKEPVVGAPGVSK